MRFERQGADRGSDDRDMEPARLIGDEEALFRRYDDELFERTRSAVKAADATIEDACSFAWMQLLRRQPPRDDLLSWLTMTAIRQAWRLSERESRSGPLRDAGDPRQDMAGYELGWDGLARVADLRLRQRRLVGLQAAGFTYDEMCTVTGDSWRTVDRQPRRAAKVLRRL
jgi:hypothetical protein